MTIQLALKKYMQIQNKNIKQINIKHAKVAVKIQYSNCCEDFFQGKNAYIVYFFTILHAQTTKQFETFLFCWLVY